MIGTFAGQTISKPQHSAPALQGSHSSFNAKCIHSMPVFLKGLNFSRMTQKSEVPSPVWDSRKITSNKLHGFKIQCWNRHRALFQKRGIASKKESQTPTRLKTTKENTKSSNSKSSLLYTGQCAVPQGLGKPHSCGFADVSWHGCSLVLHAMACDLPRLALHTASGSIILGSQE